MSELPEPINHTVSRIYEALMKGVGGSGDSAGVPMSDVVNPCDRAIWYSFRWASPAKAEDGPTLSRFKTGETWELRLLDDLVAIGCEVMRRDPATGRQYSAVLADGHLRGKIDALATGIPEAPVTRHVVECKSLKAEKWRKIVKHGLAIGNADHYAQCQLYMRALGIERALYLAVNKDTDELHAERIPCDPIMAAAIEARILRIVHLDEPPSRLHDDPASKSAWQCGFCRHKAVCHEKAFARVNCRTCLHATVWIPFKCEGLSLMLTWDSQQKGCKHHRYIPALVPGEQIDVADGDLIIYRLHDETLWIDGARDSA